MQTKKVAKVILPVVMIVSLLAGSISCTLTQMVSNQSSNTTEEPATSTYTPAVTGSNTTTIPGPDGTVLTLEGNALTDTSSINLQTLGSGEFVWDSTPFRAASQAVQVSFGVAEQVGGITLTVPLTATSHTASLMGAAVSYAYAAWSQPEQGSPSMVGTLVDNGQATFPVVGAGKYQVVMIPSHEALVATAIIKEPLSVPTYRQMTPSWCSPTTLTDVTGYHEGAWPVGGLGSVWGESSNWFLAGKAGQPYNAGYFFHWLLKAGGYTVPEDVKQSFNNGNAAVIIWNWKSQKITPDELAFYESDPYSYVGAYVSQQLEYASQLFDFFHAYVEMNVWGQNGSRRPVAWGSSLAGHSRAITGSDGTSLFFNNPSSGSWNDIKSWDTYRQEVIDSLSAEKTEVIDTTVFYADPRPANERRAVLWLLQWTENLDGSIILRRGANGDGAAYWHWDGSLGHEYGYFYEDLIGDLPLDPIFDVQFKAFTDKDAVEYGFSIRSISDGSYDYKVHTELFKEDGKVSVNLPDQTATVGAGDRADFYPAASFPIADLDAGLYHLKFTLSQGGIAQDVKYVFFQLAPSSVIHTPSAIVTSPAFCREGPSKVYRDITAFEAGQELTLMGFNPEKTWGKFEATIGGSKTQCWVSLSLVELKNGENAPILTTPPPPTATPVTSTCSQYTTPQTCSQHPECTWNRTVTPGVCQSK